MKFNMDNSLGFVLNKTSLLSKTNFNQRIKKFDISPEQWSLIFRVVEKKGLTQKELSESTYKDQANITRSIDRLEEKDFLKRVPSEVDRRIIHLYPTEKAYKIVEAITPISTFFNQELTDGFTLDEQEILLNLLKRVYDNLEKKEK